MEYLPDLETMTLWLQNYGSIALFGLLMLGIIALPVPEETLMVITGVLISQSKLPAHSALLAAYAGSICGITVSYLLGRSLGYYFIHKYGSWLGLTEAKLQKAHEWFERYGKWTLVIGYFIPGVRHFTGFSAGTTALDMRQFALFAYSGAIIWVTTFISIGYYFGDYWVAFAQEIEFNITDITIVAGSIALLVTGYFLYRRNVA